MKKKTFGICLWVLILVMEALPYGAVCIFADGPEQRIRRSYSYFALTPFGYANFGPLLTALLSVMAMIFLLLSLFSKKERWMKAVFGLSCTAVVTSLLPLMFGLEYFPPLACIISLLLLISCFWCRSMRTI